MAKKLMFFYDKEGDVLDISIGSPKSAVSKEVEDDVFVRLDPQTDEIVGFMILNFEKRFSNQKSQSIPIEADFRMIAA